MHAKRLSGMIQRTAPAARLRALALAPLASLALVLSGCDRQPPEPQPSATPTPMPVPAPAPSTPAAAPSVAAIATTAPVAPAAKLDMGALSERKDPERVLRFYVRALSARQWDAAAKAWGPGAGVTAAILEAAYDRPVPPRFEIGKGTVEGAAGSLYYEAPVVLRFGDEATPERGTLTLRRVNDVDGATAEQLRWHIERSTIGAGQ